VQEEMYASIKRDDLQWFSMLL